VVYHYLKALLDCEARTEPIVDSWGLDADAWLREELAEACGGCDVFFARGGCHCCFFEHFGGGLGGRGCIL
jgi:hypothetical protein